MQEKNEFTIELPREFIALCQRDSVTPEMVVKGFIADLTGIKSWSKAPRTDGYSSNGSDERDMARAYYRRVGYPYWNK